MAYTIVVPGNMASTTVDAFLKNVKISTDLENGSHVILGNLLDDNLDTYEASTPVDVTSDEIFIIEQSVINDVEGMKINVVDPRRFINRAGSVVRARKLMVGDVLIMSIDGFNSTPTVGQYVIPANGKSKLDPSASVGNTTLSYKVEKKTVISVGAEYVEAYQLRVVKG